jgi:hypothetical protein
MLLVGYLVAFALIEILRVRSQHGTTLVMAKQVGQPVLVTATILIAVTLFIRTLNCFTFGAFADSEISSSAFQAANRALLRIKPPKTGQRFVLISRDARQLAHGASPAFRELEPYFEGERGRALAQFGARKHGVKDDIRAGQFMWAFREFVASAGHHQSGSEANAFYQRIANEINKACDEGRLPSRFVFSSFVDPDMRKWLPQLPSSFLQVAAVFVKVDFIQRWSDDDRNATADSRELFDTMANRRSSLTRQKTACIHGWAFCLNDPLHAVEIRSPDGHVVASTESFSARPDVMASYPADEDVPVNTGYSLSAPVDAYGRIKGDLAYQTTNGLEFVVPTAQIQIGSPSTASSNALSKVLQHHIDDVETAPKFSGVAIKFQNLVGHLYRRLVVGLTFISVVAVIILLACHRLLRLSAPVYAILGLMFVVVALRVALFTFIRASVWNGSVPRYLFPVMPLYTGMLLIVVYQAIRTLLARRTSQ